MNASHVMGFDAATRQGRVRPLPAQRGIGPRVHAGSGRPAPQSRFARRGLTLVELLITITIIGLLGVGSASVYRKARDSANRANTRALIMKINQIIMTKYGSYQGRRMPFDAMAYAKAHPTLFGPALSPPEPWAKAAARARVSAVRELVQFEMPDRFGELLTQATDFAYTNPNPVMPRFLANVPALARRYDRIYQAALTRAGGDPNRLSDNASAECLYMIVMSIPEAAEQFTAKDFGDIDQDGLPEFHDAWGQPIRWIRWPAGFTGGDNFADSDLHPTIVTGVSTDANPQPDPFDPQRLVPGYSVAPFPLYPLIYSGGPDKELDINIGKTAGAILGYRVINGNLDPFAKPVDSSSQEQELMGSPKNDNTGSTAINLRHTDNIHNHRIETR